MKPLKSSLRSWLWFLGIYLASLAAFALVTGVLHLFARA